MSGLVVAPGPRERCIIIEFVHPPNLKPIDGRYLPVFSALSAPMSPAWVHESPCRGFGVAKIRRKRQAQSQQGGIRWMSVKIVSSHPPVIAANWQN
jgi:hypothetical protein